MLRLKGLERYGRSWTSIAGVVRTRTGLQVKTHAQKYFDKVSTATVKVQVRLLVRGALAAEFVPVVFVTRCGKDAGR